MNRVRRSFSLLCPAAAIAIGLLLNSPGALALEQYPERPITWLVGFPPGGTADVITRLVATKLEKVLGRPVIIDNRPGATGAIALQMAAKATPDAYTIVCVTGPVMTARRQPDVGREFVGISMIARTPIILVGTANSSLPPTLKDLLASAKANPDRYSFGSSGNGTGQHLVGELLNQIAGSKMTHVPYKGGNQAVTDVISGHIQLAFLGLAPVLPHLVAGKLKGYAISTPTRSASLPNVPTFSEAGFPGVQASGWITVAAPTGVPSNRIQVLSDAFAAVLKDEEVLAEFSRLGVYAEPMNSQQVTRFVSGDLARWQNLVKTANLPLE